MRISVALEQRSDYRILGFILSLACGLDSELNDAVFLIDKGQNFAS